MWSHGLNPLGMFFTLGCTSTSVYFSHWKFPQIRILIFELHYQKGKLWPKENIQMTCFEVFHLKHRSAARTKSWVLTPFVLLGLTVKSEISGPSFAPLPVVPPPTTVKTFTLVITTVRLWCPVLLRQARSSRPWNVLEYACTLVVEVNTSQLLLWQVYCIVV